MSSIAYLTHGPSKVALNKIAYGLMGMTWTPTPTPDEQAFEAIKTAIELTPPDRKLFLNSGEFYGNPPVMEANLHLVARFFAKYPELADRCFLSVKGAVNVKERRSDSSPANLRASVDNILKALDGKKSLDLFEAARVDPTVPVEVSFKALKELQDEGKFGYIGISEVGAKTLRKAHEVAPIAAVEIELSPWSNEDEGKEVVKVAEELGIAVIAYSPLGRGFLTGKLDPKDLPTGDFRLGMSRFQAEALEHNKKLLHAFSLLASKKGITPAQLCLAWVSSLGTHVVPIPGSSKPERVRENMAAGDVVLTPEELEEIKVVMEENPVVGGRYRDGKGGPENLWA